MKQYRKAKGFTLLELMVVVAIIGILAAMAAPSYHSIQYNAAIRNVLSTWQNSFTFAQAEAMRTRKEVIFCPSEDGQTCAGTKSFSSGWIVAQEASTGTFKVLQDTIPPNTRNLEIVLNRDSKLKIQPNGSLSGFKGATLNVQIKKANDVVVARSLVISAQGRMRIENGTVDITED